MIGNVFKSTRDGIRTTELIFVITPRVVDLEDPKPVKQSLKDLGFSKLSMNNTNIYTQIKDVFIDEDESLNFVNLDNSISCYNKIVLALKKAAKNSSCFMVNQVAARPFC